MLRRFRAIVTIGLVWGICWAASGAALVTWRVVFGHPRLANPLHYLPRMATGGAVLLGACGFVAGSLFAITLRKFADGTSVDSLSVRSSIGWGALAGIGTILVLPLLGLTGVVPLAVAGAINTCVGAISALATIKTARRDSSPADQRVFGAGAGLLS